MDKGYMMKEKMMHGKGKSDAKHESKESKKKKLAEKMIGSRVQGPDAQYNTNTKGKQPIAVYRKMKGN